MSDFPSNKVELDSARIVVLQGPKNTFEKVDSNVSLQKS